MSRAYTDRILLAAMKTRWLDTVALGALRRAVSLLGLAIGTRIGELRDSDDRFLAAASQIEEHALLLRIGEEVQDILGARWDKLPARQRPFYSPEQRFRILRIKDLMALTRTEAARLFRVDKETISRWEAESQAQPDTKAIGALVKPEPPVRRYADVVRGVVKAMALAGFGGHAMIAATLARAGWRLSRRTVQRIRRERGLPITEPPTPPDGGLGRHVTARYPNHVLMLDITQIPGLFRIMLYHLTAAFDVYSRMPLAAGLTTKEPTEQEVTEVFEAVLRHQPPPRHVVTDQGSQFTGAEFRKALAAVGTKQRFGAIGKVGSIAVIERWWRSLKSLAAVRLRPPLTLSDCRQRLELALLHYAYCRPHRALGGATPAEVYFGIQPAHLAAVHGPRGRPGEPCPEAPFEIAYLDPERRLPLLVPKAA